MKKTTTYKDAGVNNQAKSDASKILYNAAKETWKNREGRIGEVITPSDDFSGVRAIDVSGLPKGTYMNINFDGIGTKVYLAEYLNKHYTMAHDLFAMVCDDAIVRGAEPVLVGSILDTNTLTNNAAYVEELAKGYISAAKAANVAVVNGEIAELGARVGGHGPFNYNWGASVTWFAKKERMFTGKEIQPEDSLVALAEEGFRSNGLSLARKVFKDNLGDEWYNQKYKGKKLGELVLQPSKIYSKAVVEMFGGYDKEPQAEIHGFAHITGGGIPEKLGRVLKPSGLGAYIVKPFKPSAIIQHCQKLGNIPDREAYKTFNMGMGGVVVTPEPKKVVDIAIKNGIYANRVGYIMKDCDILIANKGCFTQDEYLGFDLL